MRKPWSRFRSLGLAAAAAGLMLAGTAAAQAPQPSQVSPSPAPSPDALAAARDLVAAIRPEEQFKAIMPAIIQALKPAIVQGRPQMESDFDAVAAVLVQGMNARFGELSGAIAAIYAANFTTEELRQIAAFYRTPIGEKLRERTPAIAQQSLALGQSFGQRVAQELRARIVEELRKRGHNI